MTLIAENFYDDVGKAFSVYQLFQAIAMAIGPLFGGGLYTVGGFILPFEVNAVLLIILTAALVIVTRKHRSNVFHKSESPDVIKILKIPTVDLACFT